VKLSENIWTPVIKKLLWQAYYRILGLISFHGPIEESFEATKAMSEREYGGDVYWVLEGRVFRWDDVEISPGITMKIWFIGTRGNTVMLRRGWWSLYLVQELVPAIAKSQS
jgi:hypothetical protein